MQSAGDAQRWQLGLVFISGEYNFNLPFKPAIYNQLLELKRVEHTVSDVIERDRKLLFIFLFFCGTGISVYLCLLLWIHSNARVAQPIAAQDLGRWGGKRLLHPPFLLSHVVLCISLLSCTDYAVAQQRRDEGHYPPIQCLNLCMWAEAVQQLDIIHPVMCDLHAYRLIVIQMRF